MESSTCICENNKYLKSIADTSLIACDKIISVIEMSNTIATNVTKDCHSKKVKHCYILHTASLANLLILLLFDIIMQNIVQNKKVLMH